MSGNRGGGPDTLLIIVALLLGVAYYGPLLAERLRISVQSIFLILAPIVAPILMAVLILMLIRMYWSRW